jgi:hypothetical protein
MFLDQLIGLSCTLNLLISAVWLHQLPTEIVLEFSQVAQSLEFKVFWPEYVNHTCALLPQFVWNCGPVFCSQTLFITRTVLHATIISITCDQK